MDCIGCHAENPAAANNISPSTGAPQIAHANPVDLAGGNFTYLFGGGAKDAKGHNVHGFSPSINVDSLIIPVPGNPPPGYDAALDYGGWAPNGNTNNPLMCAGTNGCHGNRSEIIPLRSIAGAHHANDAVLQFGSISQAGQGATVGTSYRFLYGVQGGEDSDWEATFTAATDHNEYKGEVWGARGNDPRADHTMSSLCSTCHGSFHAAGPTGIGSGTSPWIRHPTDVGMVTTGEFSTYAYTQQVPVARVTIPNSPNATVASADNRIVMCLSCHRAHASANDDSLRWQYDATMVTPNGCYNCHRGK